MALQLHWQYSISPSGVEWLDSKFQTGWLREAVQPHSCSGQTS